MHAGVVQHQPSRHEKMVEHHYGESRRAGAPNGQPTSKITASQNDSGEGHLHGGAPSSPSRLQSCACGSHRSSTLLL